MNNRAYAVDILRGLAIVGMVLSGYIAWNPDLPAWLFHAQLPPPSFVFDASVAGITWVDLVFPFFLFSMGAAFPLSLGRRLNRGDPPRRIVVSILKRGLLLAFFAVALGNTGLWTLDAVLQRPVVSALVTMTVWGAFFAMFVRIPGFIPRQNGWLNAGGIAVLAVLMGVYRWLGVGVSVVRSDIIILVLADVVVAGSLIWWLTRRNLWLRMGIVALIAALKLGAAVPGSWNEAVWNFSPVPWLFRTEFLQYLCIVLPGSVAGDLFARWLARGQQEERPALSGQIAAAGLTALLLAVNMWGLFTRTLTLNLVLTLALGAAAWMLLRKPRTGIESLLYRLFTTGFFWLLLGLAFESLEEGVKKDPATVSYFFITAGMASHVLLVTSVLLRKGRSRGGLLVLCGQNPMIAYTAAGYVVVPLLVFADRAVALPWLWGQCGCVMGVGRGVIVTLLMMLFTAAFTRSKIFWRT